ncbi:MAG: hypothetical protein IV108_05665 [Burkholderiales bacterium]|nr:hypothetical protein [Burkholderiales bacterium]
MSSQFTGLLSSIPQTLRDELIESLNQVERNFKENRWEPSELNGGKLCEVVYSILKGYVENSFPASASKPANMVDACKSLERSPSSFPRSIRIQIPRMLTALYEIRNNRGVGHIGGDINPNHMDAVCVLQISKWVVSELIRVFHGISTQEASRAVDALSDRELTLIWKINGKSRVLNNSLSMLDKTLVLLYGSPSGIGEAELISSIEHSNPSIYRRDILRKAHSKRLLEYDASAKIATISPLGSRYVEANILA